MKGWTLQTRLALQAYLRQGYNMKNILKEFEKLGGDFANISSTSISREVKQGLTEKQYQGRRYVKYDVVRSYESMIGKDAVEYLKAHEVEEDEY